MLSGDAATKGQPISVLMPAEHTCLHVFCVKCGNFFLSDAIVGHLRTSYFEGSERKPLLAEDVTAPRCLESATAAPLCFGQLLQPRIPSNTSGLGAALNEHDADSQS